MLVMKTVVVPGLQLWVYWKLMWMEGWGLGMVGGRDCDHTQDTMCGHHCIWHWFCSNHILYIYVIILTQFSRFVTCEVPVEEGTCHWQFCFRCTHRRPLYSCLRRRVSNTFFEVTYAICKFVLSVKGEVSVSIRIRDFVMLCDACNVTEKTESCLFLGMHHGCVCENSM